MTEAAHMVRNVDPRAGQLPDPSMLANIPKLMTAYYTEAARSLGAGQRVAFGTSGTSRIGASTARSTRPTFSRSPRRSASTGGSRRSTGRSSSASTRTRCRSRRSRARSRCSPRTASTSCSTTHDGYTPTPVVSHAILTYNRGRLSGLADGIIVTPSHNPPEDGGFKYNPPNGGPADTHVTKWIQDQANALLADGLAEVQRVPFERARRASTTHRHDYMDAYIADLANVVDFDVLRAAGLRSASIRWAAPASATGGRSPSGTGSRSPS